MSSNIICSFPSPSLLSQSVCFIFPLLLDIGYSIGQNELVSTLYKEDLTGELMRETDDVAERRRISREMLVLLEKACSVVNEVRDFNPYLT